MKKNMNQYDQALEMDDADLYRHLEATHPEGKIMVSDAEAEAFMRRHGIGPHK